MKLVPFPSQYLRLNEALPLSLRDAFGRLLLAAGKAIDEKALLDELCEQPLFAEEAETVELNRRVAAAMDQLIRQGAPLKDVVAARPEGTRGSGPVELTVQEQWHDLVLQLEMALRDVSAGGDWRSRLFAVHARARMLAQRRPDASLYHLVYDADHSVEHYSCHHALLTLLICEEAGPLLGWSPSWVDSLGRAALTMNVAMLRLQDQLAQDLKPPTPAMRVAIDAHAKEGERMLREAGLGDELCCATVALHHDSSHADVPLTRLPPERQLARLLRRVDIFVAKISRRASRAPMSPMQGAREACLGVDGQPDEIGGALLKAVGMYPPGSFVELVSGEIGIVVARGRRANLPFVAALVSASGTPIGEPALRDTIERRHAVRGAVPAHRVMVRPQHERLLALR